jgi:hypothetical protein
MAVFGYVRCGHDRDTYGGVYTSNRVDLVDFMDSTFKIKHLEYQHRSVQNGFLTGRIG